MKSLWHRILGLPKLYLIGGGILAAAVVVIGANVLTRAAPTPATYSQTPQVTLASVATLSSPAGPLPVTGKVTSVSQATILAQTSGEVVRLYRGIGDHVTAGDVIAAFENSSQQAAVLQAQGAYDAALAAYQKAANTTAQNSGITSGSAAAAAQTQQTATLGSLASAYGSLDDAVHTKADALFNSPRTSMPIILLTVPDNTLVSKIQSERVTLEGTLANAVAVAQDTNPDDIDTKIQTMIAVAQQTVNFLNDVIQAVNETPPSQSASATTLSGYQTSLAAARTEAAAAIASLTSAKNSYDSALASASTSANSASSSATNDVAAAAATLKQQQGALDAAKANLEKTLVVSPIGGTIVSLPITQGDFVNSFAQVAIVSNPGALYVDTAVTPADAQTLAVGNGATVEGNVSGVITFIAPALDPTTNKIEVKVGLKGDQSSLTDGEEVTVSLNRSETQKSKTTASQAITIPIVAAKILPTGPVVFAVTASSTLSATPVTLGTILGDQITVVSGLTPDMTIVTDARGLSTGETVEVSS